MLTADRYDGGDDRILPELVITRTDGGYIFTLKDHESGQAKSVWGARLLDVGSALEQALVSQELPWKPFKSYLNPKGLGRHDEKKG